MNLILDVDGTLIDSDDGDPIERPFLKDFFSFVFSHFNTVSVWTNATPEWFNKVYQLVLKKALPEGQSFYFIWTREQCVTEKVHLHPRPYTRKPLSIVFNSFPSTHTVDNTLIVDDSQETYVKNVACAVPISTYRWGQADDENIDDDKNENDDAKDTGENDNNDDDYSGDSGGDGDRELLRIIEHFKLKYFSEKQDTA
jgi:hypothetical protein